MKRLAPICIILCLCLISCATPNPVGDAFRNMMLRVMPGSSIKADDFLVVRPGWGDSFESLAKKYLHDPDKGWLISKFNRTEKIIPGIRLIIPLTPLYPGGLTTQGYQTVPILVYHRFSTHKGDRTTVTEKNFNDQMEFLKENGYRTITLDQLLDFMEFKSSLPEKSVVITIDDGWKSTYDIAYPILKKYHFKATLFVYTDFVGGGKALDWGRIKELAENGFDIQNHTKTHRNMATPKKGEDIKAYFNAITGEITQAEETIYRKTGKKCKYLAYPYGKTNHLVIAALKKLGYRGAVSVSRGTTPFYHDKYTLRRSAIYGDYNIKNFSDNLSSFTRMTLK
ncbi:MAG: polysaccharide deacetylase family protein [Deltaproteobacteria bacterium]|nr:polysaccharide deacetylase family protein [Deltaproteobacteria bacterium]